VEKSPQIHVSIFKALSCFPVRLVKEKLPPPPIMLKEIIQSLEYDEKEYNNSSNNNYDNHGLDILLSNLIRDEVVGMRRSLLKGSFVKEDTISLSSTQIHAGQDTGIILKNKLIQFLRSSPPSTGFRPGFAWASLYIPINLISSSSSFISHHHQPQLGDDTVSLPKSLISTLNTILNDINLGEFWGSRLSTIHAWERFWSQNLISISDHDPIINQLFHQAFTYILNSSHYRTTNGILSLTGLCRACLFLPSVITQCNELCQLYLNRLNHESASDDVRFALILSLGSLMLGLDMTFMQTIHTISSQLLNMILNCNNEDDDERRGTWGHFAIGFGFIQSWIALLSNSTTTSNEIATLSDSMYSTLLSILTNSKEVTVTESCYFGLCLGLSCYLDILSEVSSASQTGPFIKIFTSSLSSFLNMDKSIDEDKKEYRLSPLIYALGATWVLVSAVESDRVEHTWMNSQLIELQKRESVRFSSILIFLFFFFFFLNFFFYYPFFF